MLNSQGLQPLWGWYNAWRSFSIFCKLWLWYFFFHKIGTAFTEGGSNIPRDTLWLFVYEWFSFIALSQLLLSKGFRYTNTQGYIHSVLKWHWLCICSALAEYSQHGSILFDNLLRYQENLWRNSLHKGRVQLTHLPTPSNSRRHKRQGQRKNRSQTNEPQRPQLPEH